MASPPSFRIAPPGLLVPLDDLLVMLDWGMATAPALAAGSEPVESPAHQSEHPLFSPPSAVRHPAARSGQEGAGRVQGDATAAPPPGRTPRAPPGLDVLVAAAQQPVARVQPSA
jgi:hypothetical protein